MTLATETIDGQNQHVDGQYDISPIGQVRNPVHLDTLEAFLWRWIIED